MLASIAFGLINVVAIIYKSLSVNALGFALVLANFAVENFVRK